MNHKHPLLPGQKLEKIAKGEVIVIFFKNLKGGNTQEDKNEEENKEEEVNGKKNDVDKDLYNRFLVIKFRNTTA